jgi:hypothetical protein
MTTTAINEAKENALSGMKAIRDFCRSINLASSESSIIGMILQCGFPAKKIGGIWESHKGSIVSWRKKYINGEVAEKPKQKTPNKVDKNHATR